MSEHATNFTSDESAARPAGLPFTSEQAQGFLSILSSLGVTAKGVGKTVMDNPTAGALMRSSAESGGIAAQITLGNELNDKVIELLRHMIPQEFVDQYIDTVPGRIAIAHGLRALCIAFRNSKLDITPNELLTELAGRPIKLSDTVYWITTGMANGSALEGAQHLEVFTKLAGALPLDKLKEFLQYIPATTDVTPEK